MELIPIKKVTHVPLTQEIKGASLSKSADELILSKAKIMSEGTVDSDSPDGPFFNGSVMLEVKLKDLSPMYGSGVQRRDGNKLVTMLRRSISFNVRLMRLARREAEARCAPRLLRSMMTEPEFNIDGGRLLIDISIECALLRLDIDVDNQTEDA